MNEKETQKEFGFGEYVSDEEEDESARRQRQREIAIQDWQNKQRHRVLMHFWRNATCDHCKKIDYYCPELCRLTNPTTSESVVLTCVVCGAEFTKTINY